MKKNPVSKFLLALSLLGGVACIDSSHADLIIHEKGNYALDTINPDPDGSSGGFDADGNALVSVGTNGLPATNVGGNPAGTSVGLRNAYGADMKVVAGLTYSNAGGTLVTSKNAITRISGTSWSATGVFCYRFMVTDPFQGYRSVASGNNFGWNGSYATELYYSVVLKASSINTGANNRLVVSLGRDNSGWNTYLGQDGTNWTLGDQAGSGGVFGPAVAGESVLIVTRLRFVSATTMITDYWFNPVLGQPLSDPTLSLTYATMTTSGGQFQAMQMRDGANILTHDEFRLGTTFNSVLPVVGATAPAAPSSLAASSSLFSEAGLTWTDNASTETEFIIERSPNGTTGWRQVGTAAADSTGFTNTGLAALTTYYYRVRTENGGGASAFSNVASVTTPAAVVVTPPPTDLAGIADSFSEITLTWTDNTVDEEGFLLERSPDGTTGWTAIATLAPDETSYQDVGLTAATIYYYRVTAAVTGNNSVPSNVASATTPVLPTPIPLDPIYLPFDDVADTELDLATVVTGFTGYSGPGFVRSTSALSYPGLTAPLGNGLETVQTNRLYLSLDTTLPGLANYVSGGQIGGSGLGVLYVRWLAKGINANEGNTVDFRTAASDVNTTRASVGTTFSNNFIRAMAATTSTSGINNYANSALTPSAGTDLYVARFTFTPAGVTTMDLFVNQLTEGTPDASITGAIKFNTISFSKFGPAALPSVDEFRIATSWAQAVDASGASAYTTWAASTFANPFTTTGAGVDFELDGLTNLMEFVLGGDPTINDTPSIHPAVVASGSDLVLTFNRSDASELQPVAVKVQVSSDLVTWNPADDIVIGATNGNGPNGATYTVDDTGTLDTVVVTIPKGAATKKFVRVHAQD